MANSALSRKQVAWRVAQDLPDGAAVNLGIGMPEMVANFIPSGREILFHSENGVLGMGPQAVAGHEDPDLINAGKKPATLLAGASIFHHADSFSMIRGGHLDFCILGALQVSGSGDLANWTTGDNDGIPGVGGAMDLAVGAKRLFVATEHRTRDGRAKIVDMCSYPVTGRGVVDRVYTDLAVIDFLAAEAVVLESVESLSFDELQAVTGARLRRSDSWRPLTAPGSVNDMNIAV